MRPFITDGPIGWEVSRLLGTLKPEETEVALARALGHERRMVNDLLAALEIARQGFSGKGDGFGAFLCVCTALERAAKNESSGGTDSRGNATESAPEAPTAAMLSAGVSGSSSAILGLQRRVRRARAFG